MIDLPRDHFQAGGIHRLVKSRDLTFLAWLRASLIALLVLVTPRSICGQGATSSEGPPSMRAEKVQNVNLLRVIQDPDRFSGQMLLLEVVLVFGGSNDTPYGALSLDGLWARDPELMIELKGLGSFVEKWQIDVNEMKGRTVTVIGRMSAVPSKSNPDRKSVV